MSFHRLIIRNSHHWTFRKTVRITILAACVSVVLAGECGAQTSGSFSVSAALWPTPDFPVGDVNEIILAGQIRNESQKDVVWHGMEPQSVGYGQLRAIGTEPPLCETSQKNERAGTWEDPFPIGTSTPYRYEFGGLSCNALTKHTGAVEARFCVNPHMFSLLPEGTCSAWVRINIDLTAARLREDNNVFRTQMNKFEQTGDEALQKRLLGALQLRALRAEPSREEVKLHPVGTPDEGLAQLWLEFVKSEVTVIGIQKPTKMPTMNVIPPNGCWPTQTDPHPCALSDPAKETQYKQAVEKNNELIKRWNHFRILENTAMTSVADFGMWMGTQYRHNKEAREKLYAEARAMGLPDKQVSELRRFLEFANSNE